MTLHTHKIGETVMVKNTTMGGIEIDEGKAVIRNILETEELYAVEFKDEPGKTYSRFVR